MSNRCEPELVIMMLGIEDLLLLSDKVYGVA